MSWIEPFLNWNTSSVPSPGDFNRIEGNIKDNHDRLDMIDPDRDGKVSSAANADNAGISYGLSAPIYDFFSYIDFEKVYSRPFGQIPANSNIKIEVDAGTLLVLYGMNDTATHLGGDCKVSYYLEPHDTDHMKQYVVFKNDGADAVYISYFIFVSLGGS